MSSWLYPVKSQAAIKDGGLTSAGGAMINCKCRVSSTNTGWFQCKLASLSQRAAGMPSRFIRAIKRRVVSAQVCQPLAHRRPKMDACAALSSRWIKLCRECEYVCACHKVTLRGVDLSSFKRMPITSHRPSDGRCQRQKTIGSKSHQVKRGDSSSGFGCG